MAMASAARDSGTMLIVPNAGAAAVTGPMCAPNIFRSSFSNWQPGYAAGVVAGEKGHKNVVTITWKYAAGDETVRGFKDGIAPRGGKVVKELTLPFPNVEFQALAHRDRGEPSPTRSTRSSPAAARSSSSRTGRRRASARRSRCTAPASSPTARSRRRATRRRGC